MTIAIERDDRVVTVRMTDAAMANALGHDTVFVNGGRRGLQIELDPRQILALLDAVAAPIGR